MPETALEASTPTAQVSPEVAAWRDATLLVLQAAAENVVSFGGAEVESFRKVVGHSMEQLKQAPTSSQVLITSGILSQALRHHGAMTQSQVDALLTDMSALVQEFLSHLSKVHTEAEPAGLVQQLRETIETATNRGRLSEAQPAVAEQLSALAKLTGAKRQQSLELTSKLQDRITVLEQSGGVRAPAPAGSSLAGPTDLSTGLPMRAEAEEALRRILDQDVPAYVAVFYLHRMQLTNARFGEAIGNQVILFCSQHIATTITKGDDHLYRWTGPAFVAILYRPESHLAVAAEIQRVMSAPLSRFFETPSRSVYLPVKVTAEVFPLYHTNYAEVAANIDRFILTASGQVATD